MQTLYFGRGKIEIAENITLPEDWKVFQKEVPWDYELRLHASSTIPQISESELREYGGILVAHRRQQYLFTARQKQQGINQLFRSVAGGENAMMEPFRVHVSTGHTYEDSTFYTTEQDPGNLRYFHNVVEAAMPYHNGSIIHSSCVKVGNQAILFCGPSGMGKSTQARLWEQHRGCHMLSSDAPAVFVTAGGAVAHGMPWDGSDHIITQESARVAAVIRLYQAPENDIHALSKQEAFQILLEQGHLPLWDDAAMVREMGVLRRLASAVPFYALFCRPDEGAVELVEKMICAEGLSS